MAKTISVYTLQELRTMNPEAFERVHERWKEDVVASPDVPWADETMDSLKAVVKAAGGTLTDWQIGPWGQSSMRVSVEDEYEYLPGRTTQKGTAWFRKYVLTPLGYLSGEHKSRARIFTGLCKLTGYCADDNFLEYVYKSLKAGETLTDALEGLAREAEKELEANVEQHQEEDSMMANWGEGRFFTLEGAWVRGA